MNLPETIERGVENAGGLARRIVELIRDRGLRAGDRLPSIRALARSLGVSPNSVRDALLQVQTLGIVRVIPRAGAFVHDVTPTLENVGWTTGATAGGVEGSLFDLIDARRAIEVHLAARAVRLRRLEELLPVRRALEELRDMETEAGRAVYVELDVRFHRELARLGGNPVLAAMLDSILERLEPWLQQLPWDETEHRQTNELHAELYDALVDGDEAKLLRHMTAHMDSAHESLLAQVCGPIGATAGIRTTDGLPMQGPERE